LPQVLTDSNARAYKTVAHQGNGHEAEATVCCADYTREAQAAHPAEVPMLKGM